MKKNITFVAQAFLATGAIFGLVSVAGAQIGTTGGTDTATTTTTYVDPCGLSGGSGWTAPTSTPPTGNVAAPINVSATAQLKPGKLILGGVPCPTPMSWIPTDSKLTVNGVTDTFGFANWGTSRLYGKVAVTAPAPSTMFGAPFTAPALYAKSGSGYSAFVADGGASIYGGLNVLTGGINMPNGDIKLTGSGHIYENGARVCLESGAGCPASGTTTGGGSFWSASSANITNTNTGNVGVGVASPIHKLDVGGVIRTNNNLYVEGQGIVSLGLRVGAGGAPTNMLSVTGNADVSGNLTVGGQSVCRQDGTNCRLPLNIVYMVVPQGDVRSGTAGSPYRACAAVSSGTSLSGTWFWAGPGGSWYDNYYHNEGSLTPYKYCRSELDSGNYVWEIPRAGVMYAT